MLRAASSVLQLADRKSFAVQVYSSRSDSRRQRCTSSALSGEFEKLAGCLSGSHTSQALEGSGCSGILALTLLANIYHGPTDADSDCGHLLEAATLADSTAGKLHCLAAFWKLRYLMLSVTCLIARESFVELSLLSVPAQAWCSRIQRAAASWFLLMANPWLARISAHRCTIVSLHLAVLTASKTVGFDVQRYVPPCVTLEAELCLY